MNTFKTIPTAIFTVLMVLGASLQSFAWQTSPVDPDSNHSILVRDEMARVRISTPTAPMYRKADREIAMNMNNDIREVNNLKISVNLFPPSDDLINEQFGQLIRIQLGYIPAQGDEYLTHQFHAEHLTFDMDNLTVRADNAVYSHFSQANK